MIERARRAIERLEEIPFGPGAWTAGFLGIVAIRHLLELRSGGFPLYPPSALFAHYVLAYLAPLLALALVLSWASGVAQARVLRLMLLAWGLTLLPPFVDLLAAHAHGSEGAKIGYLELGELPLRVVFLRFFDPTYAIGGTTPGIRVETAVACLLGAAYVLIRRERAPGAARPLGAAGFATGAAVGVYLIALGFFTAPYLFVRLLSPLFTGLTPANLYNAEGFVPRPASLDVRSDQGILLYLVPLTLLLGAAALARIRPGALGAAARSVFSSEGCAWGAAALAGVFAGARILEGVPRPAPLVPFDLLAMIEGPLALVLAGGALALIASPSDEPHAWRGRASSGLTRPDEEARSGRSSVRAAVALALLFAAICIAPACAIEFAGFAALAFGAGVVARGLPIYLPWLPLLPQAAAALAALGAFVAGYALRAGDEAMTLLPGPLLLTVLAAGAVADLARVGARPIRMAASLAPVVVLVSCAAALGRLPSLPTTIAALLYAGAALAFARVAPPRLAGAAALLASALVLRGSLQPHDAAAAWRARALTSPGYFERLSTRAEEAGKLDAALGAASEALARAPRSASAHARVGLLRHRLHDEDGAVAELKAARALAPSDLGLASDLAMVLSAAGHHEEALTLADDVLARDPGNTAAAEVRTQSMAALGRGRSDPLARHVFLLAIDGADWKVIRPLMGRKLLPNLSRLIDTGASGELATLRPALSPVVWTSIATGVPPQAHGISDFWHEAPQGEHELTPEEREHQEQLGALGYIKGPTSGTSRMTLYGSADRHAPALWNLIGERGGTSDVISWWVTYPAESVPGVVVSDRYLYNRFALVAKDRGMPYAADRGLVAPPSIEPDLRRHVVRVDEITAAEMGRFISGPVGLHAGLTLHDVEDELRIVDAKDQSVVRIAQALLSKSTPTLLAVYLQGIDVTSHYFWKYRFPEEWARLYPADPIPPAEQARYGNVVDLYYRRVDALIGEILRLAGPDTAVIVCSDHGFVTGKRPPGTPGAAATVSGIHEEAAPAGIVIVSGAAARAGAKIEGASVLDIAPTVLTLLGYPVPDSFTGKPLRSALVESSRH